MQKISKIKKNIFGSSSTSKAASAAFVCSQSLKALKNVFPREFISELNVISFKNKILFIGVKNSFYAQEIKLREKEVVKEINSMIGENTVERIIPKNNTKTQNLF